MKLSNFLLNLIKKDINTKPLTITSNNYSLSCNQSCSSSCGGTCTGGCGSGCGGGCTGVAK